jgi:hypothetical protein
MCVLPGPCGGYKDVYALKHTKCVPEGYGPSGTTISSGSAGRFNGGVSITKAIGINLSAQTDYSKTATLYFDVNANSPYTWLCGTRGYPGGPTPGWVQLQPNS